MADPDKIDPPLPNDRDNDRSFDRQRENKQPITTVSGRETNLFSGGGSPTTRTTVKPRNYKCPNCEGEFHTWYDGECPFCGIERGEYDPDEEHE